MSHKDKVKLARAHGGFLGKWWEDHAKQIQEKVKRIQLQAHVKAQLRRGEEPTTLEGATLKAVKAKNVRVKK